MSYYGAMNGDFAEQSYQQASKTTKGLIWELHKCVFLHNNKLLGRYCQFYYYTEGFSKIEGGLGQIPEYLQGAYLGENLYLFIDDRKKNIVCYGVYANSIQAAINKIFDKQDKTAVQGCFNRWKE